MDRHCDHDRKQVLLVHPLTVSWSCGWFYTINDMVSKFKVTWCSTPTQLLGLYQGAWWHGNTQKTHNTNSSRRIKLMNVVNHTGRRGIKKKKKKKPIGSMLSGLPCSWHGALWITSPLLASSSVLLPGLVPSLSTCTDELPQQSNGMAAVSCTTFPKKSGSFQILKLCRLLALSHSLLLLDT